MAAVGLPATRSHDAEWLFFFGRVLYKSIITSGKFHLGECLCQSLFIFLKMEKPMATPK
jgi:hypothetical protein